MNKKFSTLLASALLVGSVSAYAQVNADKVTKLEKGNYVLTGTQITTDNGTAVVSDFFKLEDGKLVKVSGQLTADYNESLWTIAASAVSSNHFTFVNKATGLTISYDPKNAVVAAANGAVTAPSDATDPSLVVTGANMAWAWVDNSADATGLADVKGLTYAIDTDSTMALGVATINSKDYVYAYKYANDNAGNLGAVIAADIQAVKPTTIAMKAADLNVLGTTSKYFTLTPDRALKGDEAIKGIKFHAEDVAVSNGYVTLQNIDKENAYLRVDTAVFEANATYKDNLYKLATKVIPGEAQDVTNAIATAPYHFMIQKDLFADSVFVSIKKADSRFTYDATAGAAGSHWATPMVTSGGSAHAAAEYCTLSGIKLDNADVLTLYTPTEEPAVADLVPENILFAVSDAATAVDNKTSVEDGLYYIKNARGQYLASPIYNNGTSAEWITVNAAEQNVAHMPAFQWVVLKENTTEYGKERSTVVLTNREFEDKTADAVQLCKNGGATYYYLAATISTNAVNIDEKDSLNFTKIEDLAILGDSLLGYKNLTANELKVNRYTFNYFNPYVSDKFIGKSTDSLLVVKDAILPFVVKAEGAIAPYGYDVTDANGRIEGLKQLYRQAYKMTVPAAAGDMKFGVNAESKYAVSADADFVAVEFFFKENNDVQRAGDDKKNDFYALVVKSLDKKAGVADETQDATLKEQLIGEVRTSSFLIAPYDAPLYRRFNTTLEGAVAGDGADTVRFVEQYRKEYLQIEGNSNFTHKGIDFLGIYTDDKAPSGLGFIVDTAWVNRGAGYIKPQYLISIERTDKAGTPGSPCTETGKHIDANGNVTDDASQCIHATPAVPGFEFGKYLVNFKDSVAVAGNEDIYAWKKYIRAGFVKAAHVGDSLYILNGMFADVTANDFDPAAVRAAVKDGKYAADYIVNLRGDNHKKVTWSFRYVNPAKAATDDKRFLIESIAVDARDEIAPVKANWLKMQNGCLVLSDDDSEFDIFTQKDDALIFDVEYKANDEVATDNENVSTSTVSVIAKEGAVIINGAAGKKVVITNVLGQTIASTVLSSDNATIAAPAGVVVVAVEGEAAVKAIVK